jgi:predicted 3-demethylubiquinone-9 3-methyltransferase (glyoxalase superfamily)
MPATPNIIPCLWFDHQAEEAARFYTGVFPNSRIVAITRYSEAGQETHRKPPGSVMTVDFELNGTRFTALNGGPEFRFNEAVSFQIHCDDQEEIDHYWDKLGAGGDPAAQVCGWLKDRFGLSWQVIPKMMDEMFRDENSPGAQAAMEAMLKMKKLDIAALKEAHDNAEAHV